MSEPSDTVEISKDELAALHARIAAVEAVSQPDNVVIAKQCNVCGDALAADVDKCPKHPNDMVNHVGNDRFGRPVLLRQT